MIHLPALRRSLRNLIDKSPGSRRLKRAQRWLLGKTQPSTNQPEPGEYARWLDARIRGRSSKKRCVPQPELFSILTCVYHGSPAEFLRETARSVQMQTYAQFEWVLLAQGKLNAELEEVVAQLASDRRVKLLRIPENLGIFRGLRECLAAATGRYALPLDGDDLLTIDALEIMAQAISQHGDPAFLYSDEDMFVEGQARSPYLRPAWDPILNTACSYIWHLCAFDAALARQLGVYTDPQGEWCQDWHSVFRFVDAGHQPVHVPEVLYHWRAHAQSSTNQAGPHDGSLISQRHLLTTQVARQADPTLYTIEPFPIFRGAQEWWIRREHVRPEPMALVYDANPDEPAAAVFESLLAILGSSQFPFRSVHLVSDQPLDTEQNRDLSDRLRQWQAEYGDSNPAPIVHSHGAMNESVFQQVAEPLVAVCESGITPDGHDWPWEAQGLFELHADMAMVAGRIINSDGIVSGGGEFFGYGDFSNCPDYARLPHDPGPWALLLKQRSVDAVNGAFFLARTDFLRQAQAAFRGAASRRSLGIWLGAVAAAGGSRIAFSPLVMGRARPYFDVRSSLTPGEELQLREQFGPALNASRWYSPHCSRNVPQAYEFAGT